MNSLKIEIPHRAIRDIWRKGKITIGQLFDMVFRIDRTYELDFPESFAEMEKKHFLTFCNRIHLSQEDELWFQKLKRDFIGLSKRQVFALTDLHAIQLDPLLAFMAEPYINHKSLLSRTGILRGPKNRLKNFTMDQMRFVDSYAMAYHADKQKKYLDAFFSAAYCLPLIPFSEKLLDVNLFFFKAVSEKTKKAALQNFLGLRANLVKEHPNTFEGGDENTGMEKFGWGGTINNLAGVKFGNFYRAKRTLIPDAFMEFEINSIRIKKMEKDRKKAQKR